MRMRRPWSRQATGDAEKKQIGEDGNARLEKLRVEKRRKLASIVDQRSSEADATARAVQNAESRVQEELAELAKEKSEAEAEVKKLFLKEATVAAGKIEVQHWLDVIARLRELIAWKKA